jgi:hypothetical protein
MALLDMFGPRGVPFAMTRSACAERSAVDRLGRDGVRHRPNRHGRFERCDESMRRRGFARAAVGMADAHDRCSLQRRNIMRRNTFVALLTGALLVVGATFWPSPANAQGRRGGVVIRGGFVYSPFYYGYYSPFWGPYPYYGYGGYPIGVPNSGDVRVLATPKQAEVFVDGFYAGVVDDFNGTFQRLHTTLGGHAITLHLEGYRTVTQNIYVTPDSTFKLQLMMDKLGPGEISDPPPIPARPLTRGGALLLSPGA